MRLFPWPSWVSALLSLSISVAVYVHCVDPCAVFTVVGPLTPFQADLLCTGPIPRFVHGTLVLDAAAVLAALFLVSFASNVQLEHAPSALGRLAPLLVSLTLVAALDTTVDLPRRLPLVFAAFLLPLSYLTPPREAFTAYLPTEPVFVTLALSLASTALPLLLTRPPVHAGHRALRALGWTQATGALVVAALATPTLAPALDRSRHLAHTWALFFQASSTAFRALYRGLGGSSTGNRTAWIGAYPYMELDILATLIILYHTIRHAQAKASEEKEVRGDEGGEEEEESDDDDGAVPRVAVAMPVVARGQSPARRRTRQTN